MEVVNLAPALPAGVEAPREKPAIVEQYEVELTPRLPHHLWNVDRMFMRSGFSVRDTLCDLSASRNVDFLVAGYNHPRSRAEPSSFIHGVSDPALRAGHMTTIIVKERLSDDIRLVFIVGVDGSPACFDAVFAALYLSNKRGDVVLVHVQDPDIEAGLPPQYKASAVAETFTGLIASVEHPSIRFECIAKTHHQPIADCLIAFCEEKLGTHVVVGVDGVKAFREGRAVVGSNADRVARVSKCPVVLVKDHNPRVPGTYSRAIFNPPSRK